MTLRVLGRLGPILLLATLLVPAATQAASPTVEPPAASAPFAAAQPASTASKRKIALGLSMDPNTSDTSWATLQSMKTKTGRYPALWSVWSTWGDETKLFPTKTNATFMANLKANHITPVIVWQPTNPNDRNDPKYRLKYINAGHYDKYIKAWAKAAKAYDAPVILRFAQEMNGSWNPWGPGHLDNSAADYIKMWKRVYNIFKGPGGVGATNVKFLWSPYQPCGSGDCVPYSDVWVGNKVVDYVGYSSFNWHTKDGAGHLRPWTSMVDAYKTAYKKITALTSKPIIVAESASNRVGGDQAAWITDGYPAAYKAYPKIVAILYFDINMTPHDAAQPNWMFTSAAITAYKSVLAQKHFHGTLP